MNKCGDCIHFKICEPYTTKNECFPEVNGCKAFEKKPDKQLKKAIKLLTKQYEWAKKQGWVHKPLAYALYQVWKTVDREEKK